MTKEHQDYTGLEIAIIGMAGRFPGSSTWSEYWENLANGVESIHFFSDEELLARGVDTFKIKDPNYLKASGMIEGKEYFDSAFFDYTPDESRLLNPLIRVFHECVWEALEDAGVNVDKYKGLIGLYAGTGYDLAWRVYSTIMNIEQTSSKFMLHFLNNKDYLASLISYKLNLLGSTYVIDTACSTSLAAVHIACRNLLLGEVKIALAGAISLKSRRVSGQYPVKGGINSKDGHCRAFDKDADGTVESEGGGVVVLKRLKDALNDGDHIYAVIKGSAINNDGNRKVGYTAPSIEGQAECIKMAYTFSKVMPQTISYIEAHGTGTRLGDPIEIEALNRVFGNENSRSCAIGSVKTNIGHTDTAAGIAGLMKAALSLKFKKIPPSLNFKEENPEINFHRGPFYVNTSLQNWTRNGDTPLRAGVSSFGIGGTNVHVVLEEAPKAPSVFLETDINLLVVSAKTEDALVRNLKKLQNFVLKYPDINLSDLSYSLQIGRKQFFYSQSFAFNGRKDLIEKLDRAGKKGRAIKKKEKPSSATFMFSKEGELIDSHFQGFYSEDPFFKAEVDRGFTLLSDLTESVIKPFNYPLETSICGAKYRQASAFILKYALAKVVISKGVSPSYMIGEGVGIYVAACLAEALSYAHALKLVLTHAEGFKEDRASSEFLYQYKSVFKDITINSPRVTFLLHSDFALPTLEQLKSADYWLKSSDVAHPGLMALLREEPDMVFVEFGYEDKTLTPLTPTSQENTTIISLRNRERNEGYNKMYLMAQLGILWSHGVNIAWDIFHKDERRLKVPLPTYSFEKIVYPVEFNLTEVFDSKGGLLIGKMESMSDWYYRAQWKQSNWLSVKKNKTVAEQSILVFSSQNEVSERIINRWSASGTPCVVVEIAERFEILTERKYSIDPTVKEHYSLLFHDLRDKEKTISRIIHLWTYESQQPEEYKCSDNIGFYQALGYDSILEVVRGYSAIYNTAPLKLDLIGNGFYNVLGNENLQPSKSTALGAIKVIPLEFPNIYTRVIDVTDTGVDSISALLTELQYDSQELEVAIRGRTRFIKGFEKIQVDLPESFKSFKVNGTYLISGATGGMGMLFSKYIAEHYQGNLILIGRQVKPTVFIEELEKKGAKVIYIQSDITDSSTVIAGIEEAEKLLGQISGVIHTAGVADYSGIILRRNSADDQKVFAPKVTGVELLFSIFEGRILDFFINCSSISSSLPAFGQVAYVAANLYLDTFAELKNKYFPVISIAWCELSELGMASKALNKSAQESEFWIKPLEAIEVLRRCLSLGIAAPLISTIDFNHFLRYYLSKFDHKNMVRGHLSMDTLMYERPQLSVLLVPPSTETEHIIADIWKKFFGLKEVGIDDQFFDLGGDSLKALIICKRIHEATNVEISLGDFFLNPTIKAIAAKIEELKVQEGENVNSIVI